MASSSCLGDMAVQRRLGGGGGGWQEKGAWDREAMLSQLVKRSTHSLVKGVFNVNFFFLSFLSIPRAEWMLRWSFLSPSNRKIYHGSHIYEGNIACVLFLCIEFGDDWVRIPS